MVHGNDDQVSRVEFLVDDAGDDPQTGTRLRAAFANVVALVGRRRLAAQAVALVGVLGTVVSVFLPQLAFHFQGRARFEVDGLGRYRTLVADNDTVQIDGHAPPLGAVALVAGVLLAIVICVEWFVHWRFAATATSVLAGVVAGAFACQSVEATAWPNWSWRYGWWLFGISTLCLAGAALLNGRVDTVGRTGRPAYGSS